MVYNFILLITLKRAFHFQVLQKCGSCAWRPWTTNMQITYSSWSACVQLLNESSIAYWRGSATVTWRPIYKAQVAIRPMTIPKPLYVAIRTKPIVYIICPKNIAKGKKILTMTRYEFKIVQILFPTLLTSRFDNNNNK